MTSNYVTLQGSVNKVDKYDSYKIELINARDRAELAAKNAKVSEGNAENSAQSSADSAEKATQASEAAAKSAEKAALEKQDAVKAKDAAELAETNAYSHESKSLEAKAASENSAIRAKKYAEASAASAEKAEEAAQGVAEDREQIAANKTDIESAREELTATKAALETTQKDLAKAQRAIKFQAELNQGQTWDFETDTQEAYQRQVPSGAKAGAVMAVGGKTVRWNQLLYALPNPGTYKGVKVTVSNGKMSLNGTATDAMLVGVGFAAVTVSGHKYMATGLHGGSKSTFYVQGVNENNGYYDILDSTAIFAATGAKYRYNIIAAAGTVFDHTFQPMVIDLTILFGSDDAPTDTTDPRIAQIAAYAAAHPEYNAGELLSAPVDAVRVQGRNLLNPEWKSAIPTNIYYGLDKSTGGIPLKKGREYTLIITNSLNLRELYFRSLDTTILAHTYTDSSLSYTPAEDVIAYVSCYCTPSVPDDAELMLTVGWQGPYAPYREPVTHPIPHAIRDLCPDYGVGVSADCYNYIDFAAKQYHHRVGQVDLGALAWIMEKSQVYGSNYFASQSIVSTPHAAAFLTADYTPQKSAVVLGVDRGCWVSYDWGDNGRVIIRDDRYKDAASFKAAVTGKTLYCELSTPETIDLSAVWPDDFDLTFATEPGGSITLHHPKADEGFAIDVPAKIQYITKLSEVNANG